MDKGVLSVPPVVGEFNGKRGEFYGQEQYKGRAVLMRYVWLNISPKSAWMEQSFSPDGGKNMGNKLDLRTQPIGHTMKTATLVGLVAVLACRFSLAQTPAQQEVLQFERDACKAFLDADVAALERMLTPEFTLTLSNGEVSTRADEINELRSAKVHYSVFENYDMLARLYGDTAVVLGKTRVKGTSEGKSFDRVVQFTDTLIKRDGRWQLAAGHVSRIEK